MLPATPYLQPLPPEQQFLTAEELSQRIPAMTPTWLKNAAGQRGKGPRFTVINRQRLYCWADVCEWLRSQATDQTDRFGERTV